MNNSRAGQMDESIDKTQVTDTEYEILTQYHLCLQQLKRINAKLESLNRTPTPQLIENLRFLENKIGLLFTLIKSSAFSFIVKHQQDISYDGYDDDGNNNGAGSSADSRSNNKNTMVNGILQSQDGTVNVTLDSTM